MQPNDRPADSLDTLQEQQDQEQFQISGSAALPLGATTLTEALQAIQTRYGLFPAATASHAQTVIVGVSGGADSVCLLHLLHQLASSWHLELHVAHLDHALRADSASDADFVQALAATLHLPIHRKRLAPEALTAAGGSVETVARQERHQFLAQLALSLTPPEQQPIIALAHHADDQAETVLHHLVRGSGLQGLGGMRPKIAHTIAITPENNSPGRTVGQTTQRSTVTEKREVVIQFVRPLLYVRRATILQYLRQQKLDWREDETNLDQRYTRNYLRHTVLPVLGLINPAVVEALGRTATIATEEMARLTMYDRQQLAALQWPNVDPTVASLASVGANAPGTNVGDQIVLDLTQLRALPIATQRALLRQAVTVVARASLELSFAQVTALCRAIAQADAGGPHPLLADLVWSVAGATATRPDLLSIHRCNVLPFVMGQPLLTEGAIFLLPALSLGETARLQLGNDWQLTVTHVARSELGGEWKRRDRPWQAFLDSAHVGRAMLTTPDKAQRFAPLGLHGQHKMLGDFFTDQKIPVAWRPKWPLLVDVVTQEILWVCGLRPGDRARITEATSAVLTVTFDYLSSA